MIAAERPPGETMRRAAFAVTFVVLGAVVLVYRETLLRMVQSWGASESYSHGWLIIPICLYLVWRKRSVLASAPAHTSPVHLVTLLLAVLLWTAGAVMNALIVQQLAIVALVAATVAAIYGAAHVRALAFPLAFLLFAVPFGDSLVPPLMQWTAAGTIALLQVSGIPVYRDGMLFSTSAGDFEVARACSGIRYLTASAAVGLLYGHLALRSHAHRLWFALIAVVVPVLANAVRAYLIVVLAHLSDMRIAAGVDHFIYGWVFFGVVMLGVILIGERMRKRERVNAKPASAATFAPSSTALAKLAAVAGVAVVLVGAGPAIAHRFASDLSRLVAVPAGLPPGGGQWRGPLESASVWEPRFRGNPHVLRADYEHEMFGRIAVALIAYPVEFQDSELVGDSNRLIDEAQWRFVSADRPLERTSPIRAATFQSVHGAVRLRIWSVYALDGEMLGNPLAVKLRGTLARLQSSPSVPVLIAIAHEYSEDAGVADLALREFATTHLPTLVRTSD